MGSKSGLGLFWQGLLGTGFGSFRRWFGVSMGGRNGFAWLLRAGTLSQMRRVRSLNGLQMCETQEIQFRNSV